LRDENPTVLQKSRKKPSAVYGRDESDKSYTTNIIRGEEVAFGGATRRPHKGILALQVGGGYQYWFSGRKPNLTSSLI
jgi:hypothetical protein